MRLPCRETLALLRDGVTLVLEPGKPPPMMHFIACETQHGDGERAAASRLAAILPGD